MSRWRTLRFDFQAMASPCSIQLDGEDEPLMQHAAEAAIAEVRRIELKFSRYRHDSILSQINQAAGLAPVELDAETHSLLEFADLLWLQSNGLFDITSGVLRQAWDFKAGRVPSQTTLNALLRHVGWRDVAREGRWILLKNAGMELDFGGFGKEYAADRAAAVLKNQGLTHALVNLGGDLHALGGRGLPQIRDEPWSIDIQHPRPAPPDSNVPLASLALSRGGLATSGDYERFFVHNGRRYCHVLNPFTGWPVSDLQSISVLASNTTTAGALSTIAMLKGKEAKAWLDAQGASYLMVDDAGRVTRNPVATSTTVPR